MGAGEPCRGGERVEEDGRGMKSEEEIVKLLINFGSYKFEVRRIVSTFDKPCRNGAPIEEVATSAAGPETLSTRSTSLHGSPDSSHSPSAPLHG